MNKKPTDFKETFQYYANYYRFLELNDERVYNHIIEALNKKTSNPDSKDFINMTMKVFYNQVRVRLLEDNKYLLALFKAHYEADNLANSLANINLIIVKSGYELTFEDGLLLLNTYPYLKDYVSHSYPKNNYLLSKLKEILELVTEEENIPDFTDDDEEIVVGEDILKSYLNEIRNIPILKWEDQKALAYKALEGDAKAREELVHSNLRLVVAVAKRYVGRGLEFMDLISAGNEGLLRAVRDFDPNLDCHFTTYAYWWIRQNIARTIENEGRTIRIPVHYGEEIKRFKGKVRELERKLGRELSYKDLVKYTSYSEDVIQSFLVHSGALASLNAQVSEDDDADELEAFIPSETNIENEVLDEEFYQGAVKLMQKTLSDRFLMVMILRLGMDGNPPRTLEEIGTIMNITRERVRQIQKKAGDKLKRDPAFMSYIQNKEKVDISYTPRRGLTELFKESNKKLMEIAKLLPEKDQELLKKRYGNDLTTIKNSDMSITELTYIYEVIYPKMQKMLSENYLYSLQESFGTDYLNMVMESFLTEEEKHTIKTQKIIPPEIEDKLIKALISSLENKTLTSFLSNYDPATMNLVVNVMFPDNLKYLNAFFNKETKNKEIYLDKISHALIKIREVLEKKITLYTLFPNTRKILIDKAISTLDFKDQELLSSTFGATYQDELHITDNVKLIKVLNQIKTITQTPVGNVNIRYIFPEYSSKKIREVAMRVLTKEEYNLLKYYFGSNLDEGIDTYLHDEKLRKILEKIYASLDYKVLTLKDYLGPFNEDVLNLLDASEKEVLIKSLGNNYLTNPQNNFLYPEERRTFMALITKLKANLGVESIMTYLDLSEDYHGAVYETLLKLSEADSKILVEYLGKDPFSISNGIMVKEGSVLANLLNKVKNEAIILKPLAKDSSSAFYRYLDISKTFHVKVKKAIDNLNANDLEIIYQVFGYNFLENATLRIYNDDKRKKLNVVKDKIIKSIARNDKKASKHNSPGFYEYFHLKKEDLFYIKLALDSFSLSKLEVLQKKYGENFLEEDSHKSSLDQGEYYTLTYLRDNLEKRVEYLKKQAAEKKNYFFDIYLKVDKDKNYDLVRTNIEKLKPDDKNLIITCFGKHYLDYPLNLIKENKRNKLERLRTIILNMDVKKEAPKSVPVTELPKKKQSLPLKRESRKLQLEGNVFYNYLGVSLTDKEYLESAIKYLTFQDHLFLEKRFGPDFLDNPVYNKVEPYISSRVSAVKSKILKNIDLLKNGKTPNVRKKKSYTGNPFFDYLKLDPQKDKSLVEEAIKHLSEDEQNLIVLGFGEDYLNDPTVHTLNSYDAKCLRVVKKKIRAYTEFKPQEFYEYLGLTEEDKPYIKEAIKKLTPKQLNVLKKKYGDNFLDKVEAPNSLTENEKGCLGQTKKKLVKIVTKLKNTRPENYFFAYLGLNSKEDKVLVEEALKTLKSKELETIILRFGEDYLTNPLNNKLNNNKEIKMLGIAKRKIKAYVNFKPQGFYECLGLTEADKPYIKEAIKSLTAKQLEVLKKKYGDNFLERVERSKPLSKKDLPSISNAKKRIINSVNYQKSQNIEKNSFFSALELTYKKDKQVVESILKISKEEDINLLKKYFGEDFINNPLEINDINPKLAPVLQDLKEKVDRLKKGKIKIESFYEYLGIKEDQIYIFASLQCLTKDNINTLKKVWGEDYLTSPIRNTIRVEDAKRISTIKKKLLSRIEDLKAKDIDKDLIKVVDVSYAASYELQNNSLFTKWFNYLKHYLPVSDDLILCLYLGFYGKNFTPKELSLIFGTTEKVMLLKLKEIIASLKQYQSQGIKLDDLMVNLNAKLENTSSLELDKKL